MILFSGRGRRWTTAWVMGLPMLVVGGYWYLRAAIKSGGNPIPITKFGPLNLPTPDQMPLDPRPRFAVAHYLTEPTIYRRWFFPELDNALGPLWPLILIVAVAAAVYIVWRSRNKILRVIAAAALATAVVYLFTPLTAAGQEGSPTGFFTNTRYLMPGLVLALVLLPIARPLRAPDRRAWLTLLFFTVVYAITVLTTPRWYTDLHRRHDLPHPGAGLGAGWARPGTRDAVGSPAAIVAAAAAALVLLAVVLGRAQEVQYADQHYTNADALPRRRRPARGLRVRPPPARQADRHRRLERDHLRPVRLLRRRPLQPGRVHRPEGPARQLSPADQLPAVPPPDQRRRLRLPDHEPVHARTLPTAEYWYPIYAWVKNDPALKLVVDEPEISPQPDYVFRVNGKLDPAGCVDVGK